MHQNTFMTYETMLRKAADLCVDAGEQLQANSTDANPRYEMALRDVASKQTQLANTLARFAETGPSELLETRVQFADDALQPNSPQRPDSAGAALDLLRNRNALVQQAFGDCAATAAPEALAEQLQAVADLFQAHARTLSRSLDQAWDAE